MNLFAVFGLRSIATPSTWILVFVNRLLDRAMLNPPDPAYQPDRRNAITTQLLDLGWKHDRMGEYRQFPCAQPLPAGAQTVGRG